MLKMTFLLEFLENRLLIPIYSDSTCIFTSVPKTVRVGLRRLKNTTILRSVIWPEFSLIA